jgi:hypothetical protein
VQLKRAGEGLTKVICPILRGQWERVARVAVEMVRSNLRKIVNLRIFLFDSDRVVVKIKGTVGLRFFDWFQQAS